MITAFKVILLIAISISICGGVGSKESEGLRDHLTAIGITSIIAFLLTLLLL